MDDNDFTMNVIIKRRFALETDPGILDAAIDLEIADVVRALKKEIERSRAWHSDTYYGRGFSAPLED